MSGMENSNKFSWLLGWVKTEEEADRLLLGIKNADMEIFKYNIRVYPEVQGLRGVYVEVDRQDVESLHQEFAQLLAYFFRLHNETQGANVDLHLFDFAEESD